MTAKDPRIDAYIAKAAPFAQPILKHLRKLVHAACPDVVETMKWSFPHFDHKGIMCSMVAFKQHCAFCFWKAALMFPAGKTGVENEAMGHFGRITSLSDLPADKTVIGYIKKAAYLNQTGVKVPPRHKSKAKKELVTPDYLTAALKKNKKALATFESLSYSHRKEYVEWLTEAKREDTRRQRLATAIEWMAEGKPRNWKYL